MDVDYDVMDMERQIGRHFRDDDDDDDDSFNYAHHVRMLMKEIFDMTSTDDKDGLVNFVRCHCVPRNRVPEDLLIRVFGCGAVNSARALLGGEAGCKFDVNVPTSYGTFLLHHAASIHSLTLTDLLIRHGASTDVVTNGDRLIYNGLLPLNVALEGFRYHHYLVKWTPKDSIFKLITILCLPQMNVLLATTRFLAQHTKETKEEFYLYAKDGHPMQMAVLLMVARDIVLAPSPSQSDDGSNLDGIKSIRRCIKEEIASLSAEEVNLIWKGRNSDPVRILMDKKAGLHSALMLLDVFEKAGDAIDEYLQSKLSDKLSKDKVVKDVKSILVKAGFDLKKKDTNLSNINWIMYDGWSSNGDLTSKDFKTAAGTSSQPLGQRLPPQSLQDYVPGKIDTCEEMWVLRNLTPVWTPTVSPKIDCFSPPCTFPMSKTWFESPRTLFRELFPSIKYFKVTPLLPHRPSSKCTKASRPLPPHLPSTKQYATIAYTLMKGVKRL